MRRLASFFLLTLLLTAGLVAPGLPLLGSGSAYAAGPAHSLSVDGGTGAHLFPAYADDVARYGVTTTEQTGGSITLSAATSDPNGEVFVNGQPMTSPSVTVTGLAPGDEISVIFDDAGGREPHSLIYLPTGFPELQVTTPDPGALTGEVGLTLSKWDGKSPNFETVVDRHGVPIQVYESLTQALDLKRQPNGELSVGRPSGGTYSTVMLDDAFRPTGKTYQSVGMPSTDGHDSTVFPDGSSLVMSYVGDGHGRTDAVIQKVDPAGNVAWQWNSSPYAAETVRPPSDSDYAHVNSIQVVGPHDDVVASFRHLSSVYRIATTAHDGYQPGDVIWKLGGRDSDFDFVDDPDGGPCAQHTAYEVSPDHILLFDNRTDGMCVDQADPTGPTTNVGETRVAEYALDTTTGTATLVWSYQPSGYNAFFAGSAQRLSNGSTLIGWAAATQAMATEVDAAGTPVWNLRQPQPGSDNKSYFTYRAALIDLQDIQAPEVTVARPSQGATYAYGASVAASFSCTDRGGSSLVDCEGDRESGTPLDTATPGAHTFTVTAHDGSGHQTRVERHYTVAAPPAAHYRPDVLARAVAGGPWHGANIYSGPQDVARSLAHRGQRVTTWLAVQNDGDRADTLTVRATPSNGFFRVSYLIGSRDVTGPATRGTLQRRLAAGRSVLVRAVITRTKRASAGRSRLFAIRAVSQAGQRADRAGVVARATAR